MPTREIKTRFKLEGEQQYKKAMTDAASAIKVLNSEEKLAKAQFEATGDAQEYATEQARILKAQIEEQRKAVKAAEDAVKSLTENGVDKNSTQMQKWRTKLNNARTSLMNMETRLDKVGTELGEETTEFNKGENAAKTYDDQLQKVGHKIDVAIAIESINKITSAIENTVKMAAKVSKAIWDAGVDAGKWADDVATAANQIGVDPETYQSWVYASRFIDTSVDDIVKNWRDIDSKMIADGEARTEFMASMAKRGIAVMDQATQQARSGSAIFWDAVDYLHGISDETERSSEAMKLFGNDWRRLNPLITSGSKAYKDLADEGRSVAVVSNENIAALGGFDDKVQGLEASFQKLKMDTLAALAPTFSQVADALQKAVTALNEFVASEEGQAALAGLNEALSGLISAFLGEDNGKGTFASIVDKAKGAVQNFTNAVTWIKDNSDAVAAGVGAVAAAYAGLKIASGVLTFTQLLKALPLDKLKAVFGGKSAAAEGLGQSAAKSAAQSAADAAAQKSASDAAKSAADAANSASGSSTSAAHAAEKQAAAANQASAASGHAAKAEAQAAGAADQAAGASAQRAIAETNAGKAATSAGEAAGQRALIEAESSAASAASAAANNAAQAALESAAGAATERAAIEGGAARLYAESAGASEARAIAEQAAIEAQAAAARAKLTSGSNTGLKLPGISPTIKLPAGTPAGAAPATGPDFVQKFLKGGAASQPALPAGGSPLSAKVSVPASIAGRLLGSGAMKAAGGVGLFLYTLMKDTKTASDDLDQLTDEFGNLTAAGREAEAATAWMREGRFIVSDHDRQALEEFFDVWKQGGWDAAETWPAFDKLLAEFEGSDEALDAILDRMDFSGIIKQELEDLPDDFFIAGENATKELTAAVEQESAVAAANAKTYGENIAVGLANGIDARSGEAVSAAASMAAAVSAALSRMSYATAPRPVTGYGGLPIGTAGPVNPGLVNVTLDLDGNAVGSVLAPIVNDKLGATINAKRR